jgi:hypothetical protein
MRFLLRRKLQLRMLAQMVEQGSGAAFLHPRYAEPDNICLYRRDQRQVGHGPSSMLIALLAASKKLLKFFHITILRHSL